MHCSPYASLRNAMLRFIFPLRREGRMFGFTCMPLCICFQRICAQRTGCQPAPGFPCALGTFEGGSCRKARTRMCRENAKTCRDFESEMKDEACSCHWERGESECQSALAYSVSVAFTNPRGSSQNSRITR